MPIVGDNNMVKVIKIHYLHTDAARAEGSVAV